MESIALCRDVLSIKCIKEFIFLGVGNQLRAFDRSNFKNIGIIDAFPIDVIHGIIEGENKILVFGGRSLGIFTYKKIKNDELQFDNIFYHYFSDWIISADFYSNENQDNVYILFAHNNLYLFNLNTKNYKNILCEEKCIIYSGCLSRENSNELVVLSGTVFQEILLWKINNKKDYSATDVPIIHRLKGHNGVIFSISYDPSQQLITSTSDDRTIRLWKIKKTDVKQDDDLTTSTIDIVTTMFGHTARVWKSVIIKNYVISIGEDSLICIWSLDGKLCNKIIAHGGATIWSIDVSDDRSTIFTGGGDGAVNSWPLNTGDKSELIPYLSYDNKTPKYVNYLASGNLIVFIDGGKLLTYNSNNLMPNLTINLTRYESYCLMQLSPNRKLIGFASKNGDLTIYQEILNENFKLQKIIDQKIVETKIFSLQWLNDEMLLLCADRGALKIIKIIDNKRIDVFAEFTLPPNRECWTTASIYINNILICGDRSGNVFVFNFDKNPQQIFSKIHGKLGVQSFGYLGNKLISTGRDGTVRFYKIYKNPSTASIKLQILHWKKIPIEWGSKIIKTNDDTYILGFKEIEFMIYSCRLDRLTLRIVCGGGHRSWDCIFNNNNVNFVCIRDKQIHLLNNPSCFMSNSIISGYHTKEIHSLSFIKTPTKHKIIMSGSEDCTIRICTFIKNHLNKYDIIPLGTFDGHKSNVISLKIVNLHEDNDITKNLVFSVGGRAQLFVWQINVKTNKQLISIEDVTMIELTSFMLNSNDKDRRKTTKNNKYLMNPDTRFMDITTYQIDSNTIILFIACSDGFIRIFTYNITNNIIFYATELLYMNRCIIKIHTFLHETNVIVMTMATDGKINFWHINKSIINNILSQKNDNNIDDLIKPFGSLSIHQSGINSYDLKMINNLYYLTTGGDDNKLNINIFKINTSEANELSIFDLANWYTSTAHSAQITGVKFIDDNHIASVAIDQKFVIHNYTYNNEILKVKLFKNEQFFIADVQGLELIHENNNKIIACAYGQGLSMINFQ
ncbi:hypothetical protein HCN44_003282 [Aphidius gifuensis]|uniref:tRNA (34-2'-O)-methyltransferase regulator WDR6 n=1 Tax=Aphidius gifuensis TaxID=684658 RepID=A0A834XLE9_APHGI|nr:WD repeat-containing protein 6 [Aphidius gifuensis]KAF7987520.1 hypothetical protein HCN44_003282 [Aphidius gifuensis]